jgi:hypothetical protein
MKPPSRVAAWTCILSVSLMSCTTTKIVQPENIEEENVKEKEITLVVTHDGTRYAFDKPPPTIIGDSLIIGVKDRKSVVIHVSDVAAVYVTEPDSGKTTAIMLGIVAGAAVILGVIAVFAFVGALSN